MKKIFALCLICIFIDQSIKAQAFSKGDVLIDVGVGLGVYGTSLKTEINGVRESESDGAASVIVPIKAQYGLSNRFSIGLMFQPATYIIDSVDINNEEASGTAFRLIGSFYFLNKDKLKLFLELGIGASTFEQSSEDANGDKSEIDWNGSNIGIGTGLKYYFVNGIGFFVNAQFSSYNFDIDELRINDSRLDIDNWEADFSGAEISVGIAFKL